MQGLTYGVVRVDTEERLSVLTVQDVGTVTPGGTMGVTMETNCFFFFFNSLSFTIVNHGSDQLKG